jgi:hypothetical protein
MVRKRGALVAVHVVAEVLDSPYTPQSLQLGYPVVPLMRLRHKRWDESSHPPASERVLHLDQHQRHLSPV